jgi:hypothetical protein
MTDSRQREFFALYDRALAAAEKAAGKCQERDRARFRHRSIEALVKSSLWDRLSTLVMRRCYQTADWTEREVEAWLTERGWSRVDVCDLDYQARRKWDRAAEKLGLIACCANRRSYRRRRAKLRALEGY